VKSSKANKAEKSEKGKDKKKTPMKDINGNEVKRPLTAYMLFNNYRRPMLHSEHPGKLKISLSYIQNCHSQTFQSSLAKSGPSLPNPKKK